MRPMPYLDADPADLQRSFRLTDGDLPHAAVLVGTLSGAAYGRSLASLWPHARAVDERITVVEVDRGRVWFVAVFGAAQAATFAHLAVRLGARAVIQLGAMGGLQPGWQVGEILVPTQVVGRDGVSRQLSRNRPLALDPRLTDDLITRLVDASLLVRRGTLVTTTTIAFERTIDIARWRRAGYAGVEMEAAASLAVAHHFAVPATGAFVLYDNLAAHHTVFDRSDADQERTMAPREPMTRAAADVAAAAWRRSTRPD
jgi:uridine phosphorylase